MAETSEGHVESASEKEVTSVGNLGDGTEGRTAAPSHVGVKQLKAQGKEPAAAIILDAADATTTARIGARAPACQALRPSAGTSSTLLSRRGTDRQPTSINILEKQTLGFGSKTIGLPVKPVARMMTISLFATSHCSWPIRLGYGWNTCRPTQSRVGRI